MTHPPLKFYKLNPAVTIPKKATAQSSCFDVSAFLTEGSIVKGFAADNVAITITVTPDEDNSLPLIQINPGERLMIPTGFILDIPAGHSVRFHARSGLAIKSGLTLANHEGVIDSDYIEPVFVVLHNTSDKKLVVTNGDRIAQGEMIQDLEYDNEETTEKPQVKTTRTGGFGSTGK